MKSLCIINLCGLLVLCSVLYRSEERAVRSERTMSALIKNCNSHENDIQGRIKRLQNDLDRLSNPSKDAVKSKTSWDSYSRQEQVTKTTRSVCMANSDGNIVATETQIVRPVNEPNCRMCIVCPGWRFGSVKNGRAFCDACGHMSDMHPLAKKMFCVLDACTCEGWRKGEKDPSGFYKCENCGHLEGCHNK